MNWKQWWIGLANAMISGLASGGTGAFIGVGWKHSLEIAGASVAVSFFKWVLQHPLPGTPTN
jgi:hypothetical protein